MGEPDRGGSEVGPGPGDRGAPRPLRGLLTSPGLLVRVAWGSLLLVRPDAGLRVLSTEDPPPRVRWVARVLGGRHLVEAGLELTHGPRWRTAGGVVDAIHSATAVGFAAVDPRWRRAALTDAAIAAGFAAVGLAGAGRRR